LKQSDYITVITWDPILEKTFYRHVHTSCVDPAQEIQDRHPEEILLTFPIPPIRNCNDRT